MDYKPDSAHGATYRVHFGCCICSDCLILKHFLPDSGPGPRAAVRHCGKARVSYITMICDQCAGPFTGLVALSHRLARSSAALFWQVSPLTIFGDFILLEQLLRA
ncbi:hypothetical protein [Novosphingobium sp. NDB2Meth1]|uniref:hypothetical protein n=1 Tax=Novosphingobium sp. NDB2Meth1 TaxID=1892847 RepID=UPI0015C5449B|nr:hypothetical protein [Novosphingobium sp. NDB2Meth1]